MVNFVRPATQVVPFEDLPSTGTPVSAAWLNAVDGALTGTATGLLRLLLSTRDSGSRPVVFVGSSTTVGSNATTAANRWVNRLTAALQAAWPLSNGSAASGTRSLATVVAASPLPAGVHGVNAGVVGTTSATYLDATSRSQIAGLAPAVIVHTIGANDYSAGVVPATFATNLDGQLDALDAAISGPHVHVLVHSYRRRDVSSPAYPWTAYGSAMASVAASDTARRVFLDISGPYEQVDIGGTDPLNLLDTDLTHQTDAGHAVMAELVRDALDIPGSASVTLTGSSSGTLAASAPLPTAALTASMGTDPASVSGLIALFRASDLGLTDNTAVASWAPSAGSETAALAQGTAGNRPVFRTGQVGGHPAVRFTGASSHNLDTGAWGTSRPVPVTVFLVAQADTGNGGNFFSGRSGVYCYAGQEGTTTFYIGAGAVREASWTITTGSSAWHVYAFVYNGASSSRYYDTTTATTVTTGTTASAALPGLRLGTNSTAASFFLSGAIAEIAVVNGAMSSSAIASVLVWLAGRYSITLT